MVSSDKKNDLKKFITKDINLWLTRISGTMQPSVTGITLENLRPSTNRRFIHDTRIHRRYSEHIPTANFLFIICIRNHTNFSISLFWNKKQTIPISFFLNKHYLLLFVITAWIYVVKIIKTQCLMILFRW
jgi:hypothetical protein